MSRLRPNPFGWLRLLGRAPLSGSGSLLPRVPGELFERAAKETLDSDVAAHVGAAAAKSIAYLAIGESEPSKGSKRASDIALPLTVASVARG